MNDQVRAKEPFNFFTRLSITELTGLSATGLNGLVRQIETAPDSCIYHHTHRFLQQHQCLSPEPPNDFAYWVSGALGEKELGEKLASIDTVGFGDIAGIRDAIVGAINAHLKKYPSAGRKRSSQSEAFYFMKSVSFIFSTHHTAHDLQEFVSCLREITVDSLYFHIFEARLRLGHRTNDFSRWILESIGDDKLAAAIASLDPYTNTLDELRALIIRLTEKSMGL